MAAGNQPTVVSVNNTLTSLAVQLRNVMGTIREQQTPIQNMGSAGLQALGFTSADAASVLSFFGYMNSVEEVYYGQLQQGGTGGTGATLFNFDNALSAVWGGQ